MVRSKLATTIVFVCFTSLLLESSSSMCVFVIFSLKTYIFLLNLKYFTAKERSIITPNSACPSLPFQNLNAGFILPIKN